MDLIGIEPMTSSMPSNQPQVFQIIYKSGGSLSPCEHVIRREPAYRKAYYVLRPPAHSRDRHTLPVPFRNIRSCSQNDSPTYRSDMRDSALLDRPLP